jgi:hypothetical protein
MATSSTAPYEPYPALLTSTSRRWCADSTACTPEVIESSSVTSIANVLIPYLVSVCIRSTRRAAA